MSESKVARHKCVLSPTTSYSSSRSNMKASGPAMAESPARPDVHGKE